MINTAARGAWKQLEQKLRPFIARRVRDVDVDDVLQNVFLRMQRSVGKLRDEERFGPWVYKVARSAIVDHQRVVAKLPLADQDSVEDAPELDDDDRPAFRDLATYVAPFIAMLPSPYREALTLTELEGLTQREAADMLGITLPNMKSRTRRGRQQLRKALEDCCNIALDARGRVVGCEPRPDGKIPNCECKSSR